MILLSAPKGMNLSNSYLEKQEEGFATISHMSEQFQYFLRLMLARNESDRPDFIELQGMLTTLEYVESPLVSVPRRSTLPLPPPIKSGKEPTTISTSSSGSSTSYGPTVEAGASPIPPRNIRNPGPYSIPP